LRNRFGPLFAGDSSLIRLLKSIRLHVMVCGDGIAATIDLTRLMRELRIEPQASDEPAMPLFN